MIAVFFVFRMRFFAAWCGAEAGCISAGLGCYPEKALSKPGGGPTVNYRYIITGITSIIKRLISHSYFMFLKVSVHICFLFCGQYWSRRWRKIWLQNHPEHRLLQHWLLCEGPTWDALLEHDSAVVAASLHLPQFPLQILHSQVRLYVYSILQVGWNAFMGLVQ